MPGLRHSDRLVLREPSPGHRGLRHRYWWLVAAQEDRDRPLPRRLGFSTPRPRRVARDSSVHYSDLKTRAWRAEAKPRKSSEKSIPLAYPLEIGSIPWHSPDS